MPVTTAIRPEVVGWECLTTVEAKMDSSSMENLVRRSRLLDAASRILVDTLKCDTLSEVAALGLAAIEDLIGSEFGFVDEINAQGTLDAIALSDTGWEACSQEPERARKQLAGLPIRGYWSKPVVTGEPVLVNNPNSHPERLGTPEGLPPIECYLGVPIRYGTRIVGIIGLANKPGGFTQSDVEDVTVLSLWLAEAIQRKHSEEDKEQALQYYKGLFSNAVVGHAYHRIITDEAGNPIDYEFLEINRAFELFTGLTKEKVVGKRVTEVLPDIAHDDFDWIGTYGRVALTGEPTTFSQYNRSLDQWYQVSAYSPKKYYFIVSFVNITNERLVQEALRESESLATVLFEHAPMALWEVDLSSIRSKVAQIESSGQVDLGRYLHDHPQALSDPVSAVRVCRANLRTLELFGAKTFQDFQLHLPKTSADTGVFQRVVPALVGHQNVVISEGTLATIDGRNIDVILNAKIVPGYEATLARVIVSAVDVTAQKQAERQLRSLNEELDERVKERTAQLENANNELESFSYTVSHDLRTPLRAIDGFSRQLLEGYRGSLDEKGVHYLERVRAAAQRMGGMIDDLLELSRVTRLQMSREWVDVTSMAREIAEELRRSDENRQVEFVITDHMVANADKGLLHTVLDNLIGNAWKFSAKCPLARIEVGTLREGINTVYFVRDNGVGFDMQYADKLFVPFQRLHTREEFEGTGIGLATVRRIVNRHGGSVWAESTPEQGATFYFTVLTEEAMNV